MLQRLRSLQPHEVDIVGRVDGAGHAVDAVSHGDSPAQNAAVLDVVDSGRKTAVNVLSKPNNNVTGMVYRIIEMSGNFPIT